MSVDGCIANIAHPFKVVQTFLWFNILQPSDVGVVAVVVDYKEEGRTLLGQKVYVVDLQSVDVAVLIISCFIL